MKKIASGSKEMQRIGNMIKMKRVMEGKDQLVVAMAVGIPQPTYSRLENGEYKRIPTHLIERIANYFGVPKEELIVEGSYLQHLPPHLKRFIQSPDCVEAVERAYIFWKYKQFNVLSI